MAFMCMHEKILNLPSDSGTSTAVRRSVLEKQNYDTKQNHGMNSPANYVGKQSESEKSGVKKFEYNYSYGTQKDWKIIGI